MVSRARRFALWVAAHALACTPEPAPPAVDDAPPRGTVEVIAGSTSTGVADGVGEEARFNGPAGLGVSITSRGARAVVADTFTPSIRAVDVDTREVTTLTQAPSVGEPRGITARGATVLFADGPCIRERAADTTITTLAGDCAVTGYTDAVGADARFSFLVHDVKLHEARNRLYLSDRLNDAIRVLDLGTLEVTTLAGGNGPGLVDGDGASAQFDGPGGLALDESVTPAVLYVADTFNGAVRAIDTDTHAVTTLADAPEPQGVAIVDTGDGARALVLGGFDGRVRALPLDESGAPGALVTLVSGRGGTFATPVAVPDAPTVLWMDLDGPLLAIDVRAPLDEDPARVSLVAGPRDPVGFVDGDGKDARFAYPSAVEVDGARGVAYVADATNHAIRRVDLDSLAVDTLVGGPDREGDADGDVADARLSFPVGLALDDETRTLFIAESGNLKIRALDLDDARVRTLAGSGAEGGDDGAADEATFGDPWGLALLDGALFVADAGGRTVRRVALDDGSVTTLAGSFNQEGDADGVGAQARFHLPTGLCAAQGALWLADAEVHTVRRIDPVTGDTTTALGTSGFPGVGEGPADFALLDTPVGLTAGDDALFITELGHDVIRRVDLSTLDSEYVVGRTDTSGGLGTQVPTPIAEATLSDPQDIALHGDDLVFVGDGAVWRARP